MMKAGTMRLAILAAAGAAFLGATALAAAFGLTEADYDYLAARGMERTSTVLRDLSPREQVRLHRLINDAATTSDPEARAREVAKTFEEFRGHQAWEDAHPGQLWDAPRRERREN
jgi:hypothetical protein